jgi:threonine dehydratase
VKAIKPTVRIVGVEPEGSTAVLQAMNAGEPVRIERNETVADGLAAPFTSELTLGIIRGLVDDVVTVSDDELLTANRKLLRAQYSGFRARGDARRAGLHVRRGGPREANVRE